MIRITRVTICILAVISLAFMFSLVNAEEIKKLDQVPQVQQIKPLPKITRCYDPAAVDLHAELLQTYGSNSDRAEVRIVGVVRNLGGAYESDPGPQTMILRMYDQNGQNPTELNKKVFPNLAPGQDVTLVYATGWMRGYSSGYPMKIELAIQYSPVPESASGGSKFIDCNLLNNKKQISTDDVNAVIP